MQDITTVAIKDIFDSLSEGVYVCDLERRITYWSKSAERITGWTAEEVVGRQCFDNVLCHIDKDGHKLCGEEYCPLHRAMITGAGTQGSLLVFARSRDGGRVPMQVSTAPSRSSTTFRKIPGSPSRRTTSRTGSSAATTTPSRSSTTTGTASCSPT
jgi:PAS domain S-box-containing protein